MIHVSETYEDGVLVETVAYDTDAQTVTTTRPPNDPETRPMTAEEIEMYATIDAGWTHQTNSAEMVEESSVSVDKLITVIENLNLLTDKTNATINSNPASVIKDLAREVKTVARQVNREARMTSGRTEETETGPVTDT